MPQKVGRYELLEKLGEGGFATVHRASDPVLDREVALKLLHPELARDAVVRERFVREGRALAGVDHPNVVPVYDAGEDDGRAYLSMKLIRGRALDDILAERGPLPLAEVVEIAEQVAGGLEAVHALNLVHRDIKPANIIVEAETGRAVLLDLGIARALDAATMLSGSLLLGTPPYMAPEQLDAAKFGPLTPQTDVYQLSVTVYELLAGQRPFSGTNEQVFYAIVGGSAPDLAVLRPDLPPGVVAVVQEAMSKQRARRPAGTREFAAQLREAAKPPKIRPWYGRRPVIAGLVAALVLGLGTVTGLVATRQGPDTSAESDGSAAGVAAGVAPAGGDGAGPGVPRPAAAGVTAGVAPAIPAVRCDTTAVAAQGAALQVLARYLTPGQTLCLSGTFERDEYWVEASGTDAQPITITSAPGERATIRGRLVVPDSAHDIVFTNLILDGRNTHNLPSPTISGDRITFRGNEITTANTTACFAVAASADWGTASDTVIDRNRIHSCGRPEFGRGIEVVGERTIVMNNYIYDNMEAGIVLMGNGGTIANNVIDGNGIGISIAEYGGYTARSYRIRDNVITNSANANVLSRYGPNAQKGEDNIVEGNCLYAGERADVDARQGGFTHRDNLPADPEYVDRVAKDFRLRQDSPCRAKGPAGAPPTGSK